MVALVIIAIMTAVIAPNVINSVDGARIDAAKKSLENLSQGIRDFEADVNVYPQRLSHLATPITAADRNSCNVLYTAAQVTNWRGPYVGQNIATTGAPLGIGTAANTVTWNTNTLIISSTVDVANVLELDDVVDGSDGAATGNVRWTALAAPFVNMGYYVPSNGC